MQVDLEDLNRVQAYKWHWKGHYYATGKAGILLHHFLIGRPLNKFLEVDHINGDRKDNRKSNLRFVTHRTNMQNQVVHRKGHLLGTTLRQNKYWEAQIRIANKKISLGTYPTQEKAHEVYLTYLRRKNAKS